LTDYADKDAPLEGIAVVGLAGRFPGARNVEEFWLNLRGAVDAISFFSEQELKEAGVPPALLANPNYVRAKGVAPGAELFDARFFGFTPHEAELTDPQQRLFLECAWEALENAGYDAERYAGLIGVYAGAGLNTYLLSNAAHYELMDAVGAFQASIHNKNDHLTTRVAYKLNLRGPSITVQTACSTSLTAVCLACQSLSAYHCDMALAGGVTVSVPQLSGYVYQPGGTASPDGRCRAFDARARGTVDGSGAGVVVLKRLEEAVADGDSIYAVIKGAAINNDGARKSGYTAPGLDSQAEVIATAQALAGFAADTITYVEAHGTGTALGDPVEIAALTQAFRLSTDKKNFCAVGSVKTNIGHLDAAAGVAGLIKTILSLKHKLIPPSLHFERPNPQIDFAGSPFYVNTRLAEWPAGLNPRRAGVSSFGIGGTNAHVILEEAPESEPGHPSRRWQLLLLSAKTATALETASERLVAHLEERPGLDLADVAYTLQVGRRTFNHRRTILCDDLAAAAAALKDLPPERVSTRLQEDARRTVTFMFPGQGAQYVNMAAELYEEEATFRADIDLCARLLAAHLEIDLREILYPRAERLAGAAKHLGQTLYTQPALFVIEYALARLWMRWGVRPDAMIGHSIGEYVAACLADVMSLEDALALVAARGRLMQSLPGGAMLAVMLSEEEVRPFFGDGLSLAAVNGPTSCVASGPEAAVRALEARLTEQRVVCRRLPTSHAFHSAMVEPILDAFVERVSRVSLRPPAVPYISNVTGTWITGAEATSPHYWGQHLRQTVRFADGVNELLREPNAVLLEVGPGRTLKTVTRWHPAFAPGQVVEPSLPHAVEQIPSTAFLLGTLGKLWLAGVEVDWARFYEGERRRRVALPTYPFERQRYWIESRPRPGAVTAQLGTRERRPDIADWFYLPVWKGSPIGHDKRQSLRQGRRWLIFSDPCGVGERLGELLRQAGHEVVFVRRGERFAKLGGAYALDPRRPGDYRALLAELDDGRGIPSSVIHLWGVSPVEAAVSREEAQELSFYSLLFLMQALGERGAADGLHLTVVTNGAQWVDGHEALCPEKATVLGACKVIPREYRGATCRSIDVTLPAAGSWEEESFFEQLLTEVAAEGAEPVAAYRAGRRWVQKFAPLRLEGDGATRLRDGGVYLITGGLGGVSLELAEHLARAARAHLMLLGRTALPDRARWEEWLTTHDGQDAVSRRILRIRMLESLGAEVLTISADVTDERQLRAAIEQARGQFGEIHGVIHAAGVAGGGLMQRRSRDEAAAVLAPKLQGARNLEAIFQGRRLDFFLLLSSLSSVVGRPGQTDYCAANAFLDAFAPYYQARTGTFTVSINWGEWQGLGMAGASVFAREDRGSVRALEHPFLEKCLIKATGEETYVTLFDARRHWVLNEHRLVGTAVIPGVAYIEMVRAALGARAEGRAIELRDVFFMAPLKVGDDRAREVRLTLKPDGDEFNFWVESDATTDDGEGGGPRRYAVGRVVLVEPRPARRYVLEELIARCRGREESAAPEAQEEDLGPRWQNVKQAFVRENEVLISLELPGYFAADFDQIKYHPALMDRAAGRAQEYLAEGIYLPVSYERLRINAAIPRKIYSYARRRKTGDSSGETLTFDTTVLDETGVALVEIEGFSQKRINDAAGAIKTFAADRDARAASRGGGLQGMSATDGRETFRRILSAGVGPQVAVSDRDLRAVIEQADQVALERVLEGARESSRLRPVHPRPDLQTGYVAPDDELGQKLGAVWQEMLGIERIGARDNFFELGGDSVLAIQIIARLTQEGIHVTPQQFFQYQTIAELAAAIGEAATTEGGQDAFAPVPAPAEEEVDPAAFALAALDEGQFATLSAMIEEADALPEPSAGGLEFVPLTEPAEVLVENGQDAASTSARLDRPSDGRVGAREVEALLRQHPFVREAAVTAENDAAMNHHLIAYVVPERDGRARQMQFSLFYFADDRAAASPDKYRLCLDGARFADRHGFTAVWTPERHFHEKGGLYPNPSVLGAALAAVTERIGIRAGSVVLPLHHALRVAEEWAVVDNLSAGRVGISFTSGWMPNDFAFFPERYADKRNEMFRGIEEVRRLWRGERLPAHDGAGRAQEVRSFPRPIQPELPVWLTCSGDPEMFVKAGELGCNVLTALLTQSVEEVAPKIALYRESLARHGHDLRAGQVALMLHTFVGARPDAVLETVRAPLCDYLKSHVELIMTGAESLNLRLDQDLDKHLDALAAFAFERYYRTASLIGTPESCLPMVERLRAIGVDELACLLDFGVDVDVALEGLVHLDRLRELSGQVVKANGDEGQPLGDFLRERLPTGLPPISVVLVDELPGGESGGRARPAPDFADQ
jgi:natural product biosynthesis luciferase-like monooxygenase protein